MTAKTAAGRAMMDNSYGYDQVNNILSLKNNAEVPNSNLMGGSSEYSYEYDDLYRLTSAEGSFTGSNHEHRYSLEMKYNSVGSILEKVQVHERKGSGDSWQQQKKTTYSQSYEYGDNQPHAPIHIGEQKYSYDKNGNQTGWSHDVSGQRRQIVWDEENRIRAIADNGSVQHYIYDASGTRVLKGKSKGQSIYVNSEYKAGSGNMGNYTVYVNPYLVLRSGGYTKHYYIEGQRIVSKLGSGLDNNGKGQLKAGQDKVNYGSKQQQVREGIVKNLKFLGIDGAVLTAGNSGKTPPGQLKGGKGGSAGGGKDKASEKFQYFYHPDHLGSSSYITDASGEVYQHLEYFAFGETFVEEHSNTKHTPYLFNGKELDDETGLYYYGARYYDARTSIWLAVDPLAEKYAGWSPYNYTLNNPINLIDPDGREPLDDYYNKNGQFLGSDGASTNNIRIIDSETFDQINIGVGSDSKEGTALLQSSSRVITIDNSQIQSDLQIAGDNSRTSGVEHSVELILNPETATITSRQGEIGDNGSTTLTTIPDEGISFEENGHFPLIGQAHGHPASEKVGVTTITGTSDLDKQTSNSVGVPIYSIDAFSKKAGSSRNINRVTPNGQPDNRIGKTIGNGGSKMGGQFNIGRDALEISGGKRLKH